MYLSQIEVDNIYQQKHTSKIREGYEIMKQFRQTIERSKKFNIGQWGNNYPLHYLSNTAIQNMMSRNILTFYFEAKMHSNEYGFPSNFGTKVIDVVSIGKGYVNIYAFKKGNGVKGKSNLDTTISEALPNQLDIIKQSIHNKHGVPLDKIKCYIVIFTTQDPLWKKKSINPDVIWGKDLCKSLGITNKYQTIVNDSKNNSSTTINSIIDDFNKKIENEIENEVNRLVDERMTKINNSK